MVRDLGHQERENALAEAKAVLARCEEAFAQARVSLDSALASSQDARETQEEQLRAALEAPSRPTGFAFPLDDENKRMACPALPGGRSPGTDAQEHAKAMPVRDHRRAFGWLVGWRKLAFNEPRHVDHERFVQALCEIERVVAEVRSLAREFLGLMQRRRPREFGCWLDRLSECGAPEMRSFAKSLRNDLAAVRAAFTLPWSNGQTEGHVNRLKYLKRQMYGRASVELPRLRVLGLN